MQTELFEDIAPEAVHRRLHASLFPHRFIRLRLAYEDVVFSSLSLILLLLAGFCMGVERGKKLDIVQAVPSHGAEVKQAIPGVTRQLPALPVSQVKISTPLRPERKPESKIEPKIQYVIQLASYVDTKAAHTEAQRLLKRGFNALVVKQGKYLELRVIGYRSRTEAMNSLVVLKKMYHDGFIKRLSPS